MQAFLVQVQLVMGGGCEGGEDGVEEGEGEVEEDMSYEQLQEKLRRLEVNQLH